MEGRIDKSLSCQERPARLGEFSEAGGDFPEGMPTARVSSLFSHKLFWSGLPA
jgi:hypothetical protein